MIHDFYIKYTIKNNQYPKTLQKAVDVMSKMKFKPEKNYDKSNTQKIIQMDVASGINQMRRVWHKHRNMEKLLLLWFSNTYVK